MPLPTLLLLLGRSPAQQQAKPAFGPARLEPLMASLQNHYNLVSFGNCGCRDPLAQKPRGSMRRGTR